MLVLTNYAKNYAGTILQSLPPTFSAIGALGIMQAWYIFITDMKQTVSYTLFNI